MMNRNSVLKARPVFLALAALCFVTGTIVSARVEAASCDALFAGPAGESRVAGHERRAEYPPLTTAGLRMTGRSFDRLLTSLPSSLRNLENWFFKVRKLQRTGWWFSDLRANDRKWIKSFRKNPAVEAGGSSAQKLFEYRMTPEMIYEARRNVAELLQRANPLASSSSRSPILFYVENFDNVGSVPVREELLEFFLSTIPQLPSDAVTPLGRWLRNIAFVKPDIIPGYTAEVWAGALIFYKILPASELRRFRGLLGEKLTEEQGAFLKEFWSTKYGVQSVGLNASSGVLQIVAHERLWAPMREAAEDRLLQNVEFISTTGDLNHQ